MDAEQGSFAELAREAIEMGASDAGIISAGSIPVEDYFARLCEPPQCESYGSSANCPPHVMKPAEFRESLKRYRRALVFKIDVPMCMPGSGGWHDVARVVHEIATSIERSAIGLGYRNSRAFAGGSCKRLFCGEHEGCNVIGGGECRHPELARPSMSGLGVNFSALNRALGWGPVKLGGGGAEAEPMGMAEGMVLIG
jgi:predicted metal-binding protein